MKTPEQIYDMNELKKLLPERAKLQFQRKKGQTQKWFLEIEVKISPALSEKEHDDVINKVIAFYDEDLIEVYTEETGHWFYIYLRMSSTVPTTVIT